DVAISRVRANSQTVRDQLGPNVDVETIIKSLPTPEGASPVIHFESDWHARNAVEFGQDALPQQLQQLVAQGGAGRMRYHHNGEPYLAIGVAIPAKNAAYFEGVSLLEVQKALDSLTFSLIGAAALT